MNQSSRILPQHDPSRTRRTDLQALQEQYGYNQDYGVPVGKKFYDRDKAGLMWTLKVLRALFVNRSNTEAVLKATGWTFKRPLPEKSAFELAKDLASKNLAALFSYYNPELGERLPTGRPSSRQDYQQIFQTEPKPYNTDIYLDDAYFAHTFTAGPNPIMLQRMRSPLSRLPLTDSLFQKVKGFENDRLERAIAEGRVYFVDYSDLNMLVSGEHPQQKKYIYQPIVVFARATKSQLLSPIAIQCAQNSKGAPIFSPGDGWSWQIAKGTVWTAHNCYHELLTHLAFTHLIIEPIVIASRRQLHETHPLHALLAPHFEGTMPINYLAITKLIQPGEAVDRLVGSDKNSNYAFIARYRKEFSFKNNYVPVHVARSGINDRTALPIHHYRDDALPIWESIRTWVAAYLEFYYKTDAEVLADTELQAWAKEIASPQAGQVKDFGTLGGIVDRSELTDIVTMIIFTAGPQHAAVNFAQKTDLAFLPGGMMAGYRPEPEHAQLTEQDYLDFLGPLDVALRQCQSTTLLGSVYYSTLGDYAASAFPAAPLQAALKNFQSQLKLIETSIHTRNKTRVPYIHLLPSRIPQSINI